MARKERGYILSDKAPAVTEDGSVDTTVPRHLSKQEFARRLQTLLVAKGWHNAKLAKRAGFGRNSITSYLKGYNYPSRINLEKMAKALGVKAEELLPNITKEAIADEELPDLSLKSSIAEPGMSWLIVNRHVPTAVGAQIVTLLEQARLDAKRK